MQAVAGLMAAYDQDMLDAEWQAMLGLVDDGLLEVRPIASSRPKCFRWHDAAYPCSGGV